MLRAFFSIICHQDAARCFTSFAHPWAVCQRCSGIYLGMFLFALFPLPCNIFIDEPRYRRLWVVATTMPMLLDALLPLAGLWSNTAASRLVTGGLFGCMLSSLLLSALTDFVRAVSRPRTVSGPRVPGGLE